MTKTILIFSCAALLMGCGADKDTFKDGNYSNPVDPVANSTNGAEPNPRFDAIREGSQGEATLGTNQADMPSRGGGSKEGAGGAGPGYKGTNQ